MFPSIPVPGIMQSLVLAELSKADPMPVKGSEVWAAIAAQIAPEALALMQAPRGSGRAESQAVNAYYRAVRQLKAHGKILAASNPGTVGQSYSLTDTGREAAKLG